MLTSQLYKEILQEWRYAFCCQLFEERGRWKLGSHDWHTFSAGYAISKKRDVAKQMFQEQQDRQYYVLQEMVQRHPFLQVENAALPKIEWCCRRDVVIFPFTCDWTMVFTHEDDGDGFANGPYFAEREWQGETLYDCLKETEFL